MVEVTCLGCDDVWNCGCGCDSGCVCVSCALAGSVAVAVAMLLAVALGVSPWSQMSTQTIAVELVFYQTLCPQTVTRCVSGAKTCTKRRCGVLGGLTRV